MTAYIVTGLAVVVITWLWFTTPAQDRARRIAHLISLPCYVLPAVFAYLGYFNGTLSLIEVACLMFAVPIAEGICRLITEIIIYIRYGYFFNRPPAREPAPEPEQEPEPPKREPTTEEKIQDLLKQNKRG